MAQWYRQQGDLNQTQRWLAQAYECDTANPYWLFERGQVLDAMGRKAEADAMYRQVVTGNWAAGLQSYVERARGELNN